MPGHELFFLHSTLLNCMKEGMFKITEYQHFIIYMFLVLKFNRLSALIRFSHCARNRSFTLDCQVHRIYSVQAPQSLTEFFFRAGMKIEFL